MPRARLPWIAGTLAAVLLVAALGWRWYTTWRWCPAERAARDFAAAAIAGDSAALARHGEPRAVSDVLRIHARDPAFLRICLRDLRFIGARPSGLPEVFLKFRRPAGCPAEPPPLVFQVRETPDGWRVSFFGTSSIPL